MHRKIAGPFRVEGSSGNALTYQLEPGSGGSACKVALYSIRVLQAGANCRLALQLSQSPDGDAYTTAVDVISTTAVSSDTVLQNATGTPDTDAADVLNEWLRPSIVCDASSGESWAVIEVWETRKSF